VLQDLGLPVALAVRRSPGCQLIAFGRVLLPSYHGQLREARRAAEQLISRQRCLKPMNSL
jgi:hypothetical protein